MVKASFLVCLIPVVPISGLAFIIGKHIGCCQLSQFVITNALPSLEVMYTCNHWQVETSLTKCKSRKVILLAHGVCTASEGAVST